VTEDVNFARRARAADIDGESEILLTLMVEEVAVRVAALAACVAAHYSYNARPPTQWALSPRLSRRRSVARTRNMAPRPPAARFSF
jgi:hypothetical protein